MRHFQEGMKVEILEERNGSRSPYATGTVRRVTKAQVVLGVTDTESGWGTEYRFWLETGRLVGYDWMSAPLVIKTEEPESGKHGSLSEDQIRCIRDAVIGTILSMSKTPFEGCCSGDLTESVGDFVHGDSVYSILVYRNRKEAK